MKFWKKTIKNDKVIIETKFFNKAFAGKKLQKELLKDAALKLGNFLDKTPSIK